MNRRMATGLALAVALLAAGAVAHATLSCDARAEATLMTDEPEGGITFLSFKVDVELEGECGHVYYDLVLEIQDDQGETVEKRINRMVKLHDYNISEKVDHKLPEGHELLDYRAEVTECVACEPEH